MENILKYRTHIMALAILYICYGHTFDDTNLVAWAGYIPVEVFFFVSGVGLLHSMRKNCGLLGFWRRRIMRMLPTIAVFLILMSLVNALLPWGSVCEFLAEESQAGLIFQLKLPHPHWFIVAILLFYLIFPFFFYLAEKRGYLFSLVVFSSASYLATFALQYSGNPQCIMITLRFPVGFLGAYMYYKHLKGDGYPVAIQRTAWLVSAASLVVLLWIYYAHDDYSYFVNTGAKYYPMFALGPCLTYALGHAVSKLPQNLWGRIINSTLLFVGALTLEIYLCDGVQALRQLAGKSSGIICLKANVMAINGTLDCLFRILVYTLCSFAISRLTRQVFRWPIWETRRAESRVCDKKSC